VQQTFRNISGPFGDRYCVSFRFEKVQLGSRLKFSICTKSGIHSISQRINKYKICGWKTGRVTEGLREFFSFDVAVLI